MRKLLMILLFLLLVVGTGGAGQLAVEKIDPPGWWIGHTLNPVQVIIRGRGFQDARLTSAAPGVKVTRSTVNAAGDTIIAYLDIDSAVARAGSVELTVEQPGARAAVDFSLENLPNAAGKYRGFTTDDVIYLIMIDRFADGDPSNNDPPRSAGFYDRNKPRGYHGGDLQGIIDRLPYLKELGVTAIWITPVYDNSDRASDYHGYGAVDLYSVEEHFGDLARLRALVERAHEMGIKVIQDQVPNHTGPQHPWVDAPPTPTFFNGTRERHIDNVFNIPALTQPASDRAVVESTLRGWFANILPDLNQDDAETAQYLIQNTLWWIAQTGIDGIRADTYPYVPRSFWSKWSAAIKRQHPQFVVVGEVFNGWPTVVSFFQGGVIRFDGIDSGLDTPFDFPSYFKIRDFFIREKSGAISEVLAFDFYYPRPGQLVPFLGNHDVMRFASEPGATPEKQILAFTYLLTMRGTPQLYAGDEIGMKGGVDPDNRRDFPGGFPGDARSAFTNEGRTKEERKIFDAVREVLAVRQAQPALRGGDMLVLHDSDGLLTYLRKRDNEAVIVAINNTDATQKWSVEPPAGLFPDGVRLIDLLGESKSAEVKNGKVKVKLKARRAAIFKQG